MNSAADSTFQDTRRRLLRLSNRLAEIYDRRTENPLHMIEAPDAGDDLIVAAILGGKEVGKTTLINALAGREVARERLRFRGTEDITAYLHKDARQDCQRRLEGCGPVVYEHHDQGPLRHLVLLDMPDFDSDFVEHFEIVRQTLPRLDRVVWLVSHEKYANQSLIDVLKRCAQNPENFLFVLNKLDLVADAHGREEAERMTRDFETKLARQLGLPAGKLNDRAFGISAAQKGFDFARLAKRVLAPVDGAEAARTRAGNRAHALTADLGVLNATYPVRSDLKRLNEIGESLSQQARELGGQWGVTARGILTRSPGLLDEWARQVYRLRIAAWPLLSLPFGSVLLLLGKLLGLRSLRAGAKSDDDPETLADEILESETGRSVEAIAQCWHTVRGPRPDLAELLHVSPPYPWEPASCAQLADRTREDLARHIADRETELIAEVRRPAGRGTTLRWILLLMPLIWFALAQPILEAVLRTGAQPTSVTGWMHLAYTVVLLLGASHWLKSIAILLAVYGLYALVIYARAKHTARRFLFNRVLDALGPLLVQRLESGLRGPVDTRSGSLRQARDQLEAVAAAVG